jgi:hypothetical protein
MPLRMGSMSLTTLAVEISCRAVGYTGLAILTVDDYFTRRRKAPRQEIGASVTVSRAKRQKRVPPRAASRAS